MNLAILVMAKFLQKFVGRYKYMFGRTLLLITAFIALFGISIMAFSITDVNTSKQINQPLYQPVSHLVSGQVAGNDFKQVSTNSPSTSTIKKTGKTSHLLSVSAVKKLAKKFIKQHGASPGTPKLVKYNGKRVYIVPVIQNKIKVGEIDIDAKNGKNLGGAGGAPK
jgi:hypothetical protein